MAAVAERLVLRGAAPAQRDTVTGLEGLAVSAVNRDAAGDEIGPVLGDAHLGAQVWLDVRLASAQPEGQRAGRAVLDHAHHLGAQHAVLVGRRPGHLPDIGAPVAAEPGMLADAPVVADLDLAARIAGGPLAVTGDRRGLGAVEADT